MTGPAPLVLTDVADGVATLTLNNPDERNTLTAPMVAEIVAAMDAFEADEAVGALVVTGTPPAFCAGANLGNLAEATGDSLGTIYDAYNAGHQGTGDPAWNGAYTVATTVEDTVWTCEIAIPFQELGDARVSKGTVWGFNVARVRIGNASEYGQWVPTYGFAHRPRRFGFLFFE